MSDVNLKSSFPLLEPGTQVSLKALCKLVDKVWIILSKEMQWLF